MPCTVHWGHFSLTGSAYWPFQRCMLWNTRYCLLSSAMSWQLGRSSPSSRGAHKLRTRTKELKNLQYSAQRTVSRGCLTCLRRTLLYLGSPESLYKMISKIRSAGWVAAHRKRTETEPPQEEHKGQCPWEDEGQAVKET